MYIVINGRAPVNNVPEDMLFGLMNAINSSSKVGVTAAFEKHIDLLALLTQLNVLAGTAHVATYQAIRARNLNPDLPKEAFSALIEDIDRKIDAARQFCKQNAPAIPADMYDENYTSLPAIGQTMYDSTSYIVPMTYIHSRTSLYAGQRYALSPSEEARVQVAAEEILILTRPRWREIRPITSVNLVSLFICGTVLLEQKKKDELLRVLEKSHRGASGRAYQRVIQALTVLWEEQSRVSEPRIVDWWIFLKEKEMLDFSLYGV